MNLYHVIFNEYFIDNQVGCFLCVASSKEEAEERAREEMDKLFEVNFDIGITVVEIDEIDGYKVEVK
jgi:hypothetical protein